MPNVDLAVYTVHGLFWSAFGLTLLILRLREGVGAATSKPADVSHHEESAPFSRAVVAVHVLAFGIVWRSAPRFGCRPCSCGPGLS